MPVSTEEFKQAINDMELFKAPRVDGFPAGLPKILGDCRKYLAQLGKTIF